jgi:hypothetical protein
MNPLKEMWDAWTPIQSMNVEFKDPHFQTLMQHQIDEMLEHEEAGLISKRDAELIDMMCVAHNWLRSKYPDMVFADFQQIMLNRIRTRYVDQTLAITVRDWDRFGPGSN